MRKMILAFFASLIMGVASPALAGSVIATVALDKQKMYVVVVTDDGTTETAIWNVSTGRPGLETPIGTYKPLWLDADHYSTQYDNAPMPYAVFFSDGKAIHAATAGELRYLGKKADSHGCVRLAPENAQLFFNLVTQYGKKNTTINIVDNASLLGSEVVASGDLY